MSKASARMRRLRAQNAMTQRASGAGSQYDFGAQMQPGMGLLSLASGQQQDHIALQLFHWDWQAKKIVNIPVDDALRDGWELKGSEAAVAKLTKAQDRLKMGLAVRQALRLERLIGGAAIFLGADDGMDDPAVPLGQVKPGGLRFLNVMPRSRVAKIETDMDPLSPNYGRPSHFWISGKRVHHSRLVLFTGDPLLDVPDSTLGGNSFDRNDGFGHSVLLSIYDDLMRATGTRQNAFHLVGRAGSIVATIEANMLDGSEAADANMQAMRDIVNQLNAFRGAVIPTQPGGTQTPVTSITPSFGSVPELLMSFLQVLSAASDIPATRFLGQAPGGLNATGESDLENYYGRIESDRRRTLAPRIMQLLDVVRQSEGITEAIEVDFQPLWTMSEKEAAETKQIKANTVIALVDAGIATASEAATAINKAEVLDLELAGEGLPPEGTPSEEEPPAPPLSETMAALLQ